jgi:CubicO group peptidase (beta-lactamase class C family)
MVRRRVAVLVLLLSFGSAVVALADPVDDFINEQRKAYDLPGLSVAVVSKGQVIKAEGYGLADRDRHIPATRDTVYKIASVSKQFIATGIMLLAQQKRIDLDDSVGKYLGQAPASWARITLRHLLTHTSGMVRESPAFTPFKNVSDADLIRAVYKVPLRFTPGEKWEYCNSGYVAAAEIIRVVSGQPWWEFLHEKVFAPADMTTTLPTNTMAKLPHRAVGYAGDDNTRKADEWVALRASGAFLSTVVDMAKWDALLYTDRILTDTSRREMWTRARLSGGSAAAYGLGWHVDVGVGKRQRIWHGGGLPGFTSHFVRYVDDGLTVIALSNGGDSDMGAIANGVAALYLR